VCGAGRRRDRRRRPQQRHPRGRHDVQLSPRAARAAGRAPARCSRSAHATASLPPPRRCSSRSRIRPSSASWWALAARPSCAPTSRPSRRKLPDQTVSAIAASGVATRKEKLSSR
jgi:hypothetical protein